MRRKDGQGKRNEAGRLLRRELKKYNHKNRASTIPGEEGTGRESWNWQQPPWWHSAPPHRLVPMASSSSMKMMDGAFSLARAKASRTSLAPSPMNICTSWGPASFRKVAWGGGGVDRSGQRRYEKPLRSEPIGRALASSSLPKHSPWSVQHRPGPAGSSPYLGARTLAPPLEAGSLSSQTSPCGSLAGRWPPPAARKKSWVRTVKPCGLLQSNAE